VKYNLRTLGLDPLSSFLLSTACPWGLTLVLAYQKWFVALINWSALLCLGIVNFVVPLGMYVAACRDCEEREEGSALGLLCDAKLEPAGNIVAKEASTFQRKHKTSAPRARSRTLIARATMGFVLMAIVGNLLLNIFLADCHLFDSFFGRCRPPS
jgi:hypothetical protein